MLWGIPWWAWLIGAGAYLSSKASSSSVPITGTKAEPGNPGAIPVDCDPEPGDNYAIHFRVREVCTPNESEDTGNWVEMYGRTPIVLNRWVICLVEGDGAYRPSLWRQVPGREIEHSWTGPTAYSSHQRTWAAGEAHIARRILIAGMDPSKVDSPDNGCTSLRDQREGYERRGPLWHP